MKYSHRCTTWKSYFLNTRWVSARSSGYKKDCLGNERVERGANVFQSFTLSYILVSDIGVIILLRFALDSSLIFPFLCTGRFGTRTLFSTQRHIFQFQYISFDDKKCYRNKPLINMNPEQHKIRYIAQCNNSKCVTRSFGYEKLQWLMKRQKWFLNTLHHNDLLVDARNFHY